MREVVFRRRALLRDQEGRLAVQFTAKAGLLYSSGTTNEKAVATGVAQPSFLSTCLNFGRKRKPSRSYPSSRARPEIDPQWALAVLSTVPLDCGSLEYHHGGHAFVVNVRRTAGGGPFKALSTYCRGDSLLSGRVLVFP